MYNHCNYTETNECAPMPCENGGSCTDLHLDFRCDCIDGFEGDVCQTSTFPFKISEGVNISRAVSQISMSANRTLAWTVPLVVTKWTAITAAVSRVSWEILVIQVSCLVVNCVVEGIVTLWFPLDIDECSSSPCVNGTCIDIVNGYICNCVSGFTGDICQSGKSLISLRWRALA